MILLTLFKKYLKVSLFLIFSVISLPHLSAQFTYSGLRLSYQNTRFDGGGYEERTRINGLVANLDLIHRPLRNIGVGISARIPIYSNFGYNFTSADGSYSEISGGEFDEQRVDYANGQFEYDIVNTLSITFLGRAFFDTEYNIFLDVRYTIESYRETFQFYRSASDLPDENFQHEETIKVKGFGFTLGYQPKIGDHFYFTYALTVDFLGYDQTSFDYTFQKSNSTFDENFITVKSKIDDTQTSFDLSAGIGYVF